MVMSPGDGEVGVAQADRAKIRRFISSARGRPVTFCTSSRPECSWCCCTPQLVPGGASAGCWNADVEQIVGVGRTRSSDLFVIDVYSVIGESAGVLESWRMVMLWPSIPSPRTSPGR